MTWLRSIAVPTVADFLAQHQTLVWWLAVTSLVMFIGGLVLMPILLTRMRRDHFVRRGPAQDSWSQRHPAIRAVALVAKNILGLVLLVSGMAMLVLPGQGIITILVGISLLNFPGKRRLERKIIRQRPVHQAINWIRARAQRPPLIVPEQ